MAARLTTGLVFPLRRLPPEILLPGLSPSHEAKCFSDFQRFISPGNMPLDDVDPRQAVQMYDIRVGVPFRSLVYWEIGTVTGANRSGAVMESHALWQAKLPLLGAVELPVFPLWPGFALIARAARELSAAEIPVTVWLNTSSLPTTIGWRSQGRSTFSLSNRS